MAATTGRITSLAAAVALLSVAVTHAVEQSPSRAVSRYFPACSAVDSLARLRAIRWSSAVLAQQAVYVVPVGYDSAGYPMLDTAGSYHVTDSTYLSVICTRPDSVR